MKKNKEKNNLFCNKLKKHKYEYIHRDYRLRLYDTS